ncbi:MAG: hypothetical protein ACRD3T_03375 [Terriglobia bacterium]
MTAPRTGRALMPSFAVSLRRVLVVQIVVGCLFAGRAARSEDVTLEVQPATIAVSPWYQQVEACVVLKNASNSALLKPKLTFFSNDGFQVEVGRGSRDSLRVGESVAWPVRVTHIESARVPGTVQFEASFTAASSGAGQHAFATLSVAAAADAAQPKPVEISLEGTFDAIAQHRPGVGYLLVTNSLDVPVTVTGVRVQKPESIQTDSPQKFAPIIVPAHSTGETGITLEAASRLTPGTYVVLLDVSMEWDRDGHHESRHLMVSKPVSVGIFFESDLLKLLGVPSFLLLPGCLFLFTMQLLVTLGVLGVKDVSRLPQLPVTAPGFWIIAVTFSALFAYFYNLATGINYLDRYGVDDLRNAWLWSIVIGVAFYLLAGLITKKWREARVPTTQDEPIAMLRKMSKHGVGLEVVPVKYLLNKEELHGYPAERMEDDQTLLWVVPKITVAWEDSAEAEKAQDAFEQQVNARKKLHELADTLERAVREKQASVSWSAVLGAVAHPYHLKVETITGYSAPEVIVDST